MQNIIILHNKKPTSLVRDVYTQCWEKIKAIIHNKYVQRSSPQKSERTPEMSERKQIRNMGKKIGMVNVRHNGLSEQQVVKSMKVNGIEKENGLWTYREGGLGYFVSSSKASKFSSSFSNSSRLLSFSICSFSSVSPSFFF